MTGDEVFYQRHYERASIVANCKIQHKQIRASVNIAGADLVILGAAWETLGVEQIPATVAFLKQAGAAKAPATPGLGITPDFAVLGNPVAEYLA